MVRDLYRGDYLELMREIPAGSVDMELDAGYFEITRKRIEEAEMNK